MLTEIISFSFINTGTNILLRAKKYIRGCSFVVSSLFKPAADEDTYMFFTCIPYVAS